jgi:DNA-binding response OmpR family regulator
MARIAIYEEDEFVRALLQEWLSEAGYCVLIPTLRDASLPAGESVDLVIVSVFMPKERGRQLIHSIREMHPLAPLLAVSGQFRPGLAPVGATADALGVQRIVAKPFGRQSLLDAVRAMIGLPQLDSSPLKCMS